MAAETVDLTLLRQFLLRARNADGGWGYQAGKASRLEPTCWAILALGRPLERNVLEQWPCAEGLLLERHGAAPNYGFHGQAMIVLRTLNLEHAAGNPTLLAALQRVKGTRTTRCRRGRGLTAPSAGWSRRRGVFSRRSNGRPCPARSSTAAESSSPSNCWSTDAAQRAAGTTVMRTCSDRT